MILVSLNVGMIFIYGEFRETLVKDGLRKKNRLHYGNKISGLFPGTCFKNSIAIMYFFFFFYFIFMWFWGNLTWF